MRSWPVNPFHVFRLDAEMPAGIQTPEACHLLKQPVSLGVRIKRINFA